MVQVHVHLSFNGGIQTNQNKSWKWPKGVQSSHRQLYTLDSNEPRKAIQHCVKASLNDPRVRHEATFSRVTLLPLPRPYLSTNAMWIVVGRMAVPLQPYKVGHFSPKQNCWKYWSFSQFYILLTCVQMFSFKGKSRHWHETYFKWPQIFYLKFNSKFKKTRFPKVSRTFERLIV